MCLSSKMRGSRSRRPVSLLGASSDNPLAWYGICDETGPLWQSGVTGPGSLGGSYGGSVEGWAGYAGGMKNERRKRNARGAKRGGVHLDEAT